MVLNCLPLNPPWLEYFIHSWLVLCDARVVYDGTVTLVPSYDGFQSLVNNLPSKRLDQSELCPISHLAISFHLTWYHSSLTVGVPALPSLVLLCSITILCTSSIEFHPYGKDEVFFLFLVYSLFFSYFFFSKGC